MSGPLHARWRRLASLLATGALVGEERGRALRHVSRCASCRQDLESSRALLQLFASDPVKRAEPEVPASLMLARVEARLRETEARRDVARAPFWPRVSWALAAAAAVLLAALALERRASGPQAPPAAQQIVLPAEALSRLERNVAREQAARYLNEAQDLLVTLASPPQRCDRATQRVDMAEEARRGRELLRRRALLVEMDRQEVALARPVLEDVERMLHEVASLDACARQQDIQAIRREIERRRLLMKIDLTTRELLG